MIIFRPTETWTVALTDWPLVRVPSAAAIETFHAVGTTSDDTARVCSPIVKVDLESDCVTTLNRTYQLIGPPARKLPLETELLFSMWLGHAGVDRQDVEIVSDIRDLACRLLATGSTNQ